MRRALALLAAACVLACDSAVEPRPDPAPAPAAPSSAAAPVPAAPPPPAIDLPPRGEARAVRSGDRYTLVSNGAPAADALDALAAEAGFTIEGAPPPAGAGGTIEARDVSALAALRAIRLATPFVAHFERGATGRVTLARVTLGAEPEPTAADSEPDAAAADRAEPAGEEAEEPEPFDEREMPGEAERRAAVDRDWQDPRDSVRLEAIEQMEPDLDAEKIATLLRSDPSGEVRAAAAELISDGDAFAAMEPLLAALDDRDSVVVLAAVRSLEDVYDTVPNPRIRERVSALREHPDADVRAAIADFEEWIAP